MMKTLTYVFSFLMGRYNSILKPSTWMLVDQLLVRVRKFLMTSMVSLVGALLLTGGVIISVIEFTRQVDQYHVVWPSATLIGGLSLFAISLAILTYSFTSRAFDLRYIQTKAHSDLAEAPDSHMPSPLEQALSALVMDFVEERKLKRREDEKTESNRVTETSSIYENTALQ